MATYLIFNNHLLKTKLLAHLNDPIQTVIAEYSNFLGSSFLRDLYETDTLVAGWRTTSTSVGLVGGLRRV